MKILKIVITICFIIVLSSCLRSKNGEFVGPGFCPTSAFQEIKPLSISNDSIDFTVDKVCRFSASYNESIDWSLSVVGKTSGARREYSGRSASFDIQWYGNSDIEQFFKEELVDVFYTYGCKPTKKFEILIKKRNNFVKTGRNAYLVSAIELSTDAGAFSGGGGVNDSVMAGIPNPALGVTDSFPSPIGGKYFKFRVLRKLNQPAWYYGGVFVNGFRSDSLLAMTTDPSRVYLNLYLNNGGIPGHDAQVTLLGAKKTKIVPMNWTGWKMVSIKLSDLNIYTLDKISGIEIGLGPSSARNIYGSVLVDFVIFTKDEPFIKNLK